MGSSNISEQEHISSHVPNTVLLTINFPLTATRREEKRLFSLLVTVKLKSEIISQGDRELIVNMTILET